MKKRNVVTASALALLLASSALAQGALVGVDKLDDQIDDIQEDVTDDLNNAKARDRLNNQYAQGWTGSVALGFSATSGNTDTADLSVGGRFRYGDGPWNHTIGFGAEFAEDNDVRNKEEVFLTYDVNRYVNDNVYIFGLGSVRYDNFGSNKVDAFMGFGPGYRIINREHRTWRIQGGPGIRYVEDRNGANTTEVAGILSSRHFWAITDTVSISNDLDILISDEDVLATSNIGVNFRVTDKVSTRVSYRTEWDSDPLPGLSRTDSSLGVSLVFGF